MKKNLKLDTKGYQKLLLELTKAEAELHTLRYHNGKNIVKTLRWYDDVENYQQHLKEQTILKKINMLQIQLKTAEIIEKNNNQGTIDIDDIIRLDVIDSNNDSKEEMLIKLVGGLGNYQGNPLEISINSPLGDAIYNKELGEKISYNVGSELFSVVIKEKLF